MATIKVKPAGSATYDLTTLGECMIRLSPLNRGRIEYAQEMDVWVGGGEYNVSYACSRLGLTTAWLSRNVDNPLGRLVMNHARSVGVDVSHVKMVKYDGVGKKDRVGLNFTEVGIGPRASVTMYDRGHSACSHMQPDDIDFAKVFEKEGARWLHTGGIFTALGPNCAETCKKALEIAHKNGTITSYDLNFRSKLWSSEEAIKVTKQLLPFIDILIGNEEDFQKVLGYKVEGTDANLTTLPVEQYKKMVQRVVADNPTIAGVGTTLREVLSGLINNWSAILYYDGKFHESRKYEKLEIEDRVGGGDGFATGLVYGFVNDLGPDGAVNFGAAHGALAQTTRGDTSMLTLEEVLDVMGGAGARIKR